MLAPSVSAGPGFRCRPAQGRFPGLEHKSISLPHSVVLSVTHIRHWIEADTVVKDDVHLELSGSYIYGTSGRLLELSRTCREPCVFRTCGQILRAHLQKQNLICMSPRKEGVGGVDIQFTSVTAGIACRGEESFSLFARAGG